MISCSYALNGFAEGAVAAALDAFTISLRLALVGPLPLITIPVINVQVAVVSIGEDIDSL